MTREYALIGLVVGIIIGAVAMRFGNRKLRQQQALQYELEKTKLSWKSTVKSWLATLPAARNCWIPWRMITASCISIWRKAPAACCRKCLRSRIRSVTVWRSLRRATIRRQYKCHVIILKARLACYVAAQSAINRTPLRNLSGASLAPSLYLSCPSYYHCYCAENSITSICFELSIRSFKVREQHP